MTGYKLQRLCGWVVVVILCAAVAVSCRLWTTGDWPAGEKAAQVSSRSLTLNLQVSYASNLFYVVDQLSAWDPHTRPYFRDFWDKRFGKSEKDLKVLDGYRKVRALYPWGVLEPVFFGPGNQRSIQQRLHKIAPDSDAKIIWQALEHFRPNFDRVWTEAAYLLPMTKELATNITEKDKQILEEVRSLFGAAPMTIDVLGLWSPEPKAGGGGYNGGQIALEMPQGRPLERINAVLWHESLHAFQESQEQKMSAFAAEQGIPYEIMHEAILYAIAPGLWERRHGRADPLPGQIAEMEKAEVSPEDTLLQTRKLAVALESVTDQHLRQGKTLEEYLPILAKTWKRLIETDPYLMQAKELKERPAEAGMMLTIEDQRLFINSFMPRSPAEMHGIRVGDEILKVRGKTLEEWSKEGVSPGKVGWRELRGKAGEIVGVTVKRGDRQLDFQVRLTILGRPTKRPSEPQVAVICRREVAEAINGRLNLYLDAFSPEFIKDKLDLIQRKPLIIAMSSDDISIPEEFRYLLPMDHDQMMSRLKKGEAVAAEKEMAGRPVVLLAAPTMKALLNLINEYDFSRVLQAVEEQASSMPKDVGEKKQGQNKSGAFQIKWGWDGKNSLDRICSIDIIPPFKYFKNLRTF
jgi:hypothetical protein